MSNIIISTKLKTTNIGNEALSNELIRMSTEFCKPEDKLKFVGRPFGLDRYTIHQLNENDILADFDSIAERIAKTVKKIPNSEFEGSDLITLKTNLLNVDGVTVKTEKLRRIARDIRKAIYSFFPYSSHYKERLSFYKNADFYIYSGAGEIGEADYFYRQLLDLRVAQLLGVKTCAINQSVELLNGKYKDLLAHVYANMYRIVVRGNITREELIRIGVDESKIFLCPDTAFYNEMDFQTKQKWNKKIAINFTEKTFKSKHIEPLIEKLIANDYKLYFVSNEPKGDKKIAEHLNKKYGIPFTLESKGYKDYCKFIQQFNLLISCRLHSNELAITAGVPVLPIEGNIHKTTEVFSLVNYPISAVNYNSDEYGSQIYNNLIYLEDNFETMQKWIEDNLTSIAEKTKGNFLKAVY
ncbi:polysaccharide pyruvyl transferase family protein [Flavobacterium sp. J49]|uniref:polysaccharide pyruvyl transferase family protein n=1 Tax=Flavobacterium sp. J49 TaxID=2718534 RepID=UPI0015933861|nr:polysaccharide pyruvyl transferase family protein [Flavobacterium sp. J49]MBF6640021.1 polysaccharide pyruvyl transferase family protein [Flavobacterium sp. J49]NIC01266.1 polysaccharide pyruvyl transferase family protein [Flavobacterium sp. J49]